MGICACEPTQQGVCLTCSSADPKCGQIIQQCSDAIQSLLKAGCNCCVSINNQPVCCGN
jgi:hypothetical protein